MAHYEIEDFFYVLDFIDPKLVKHDTIPVIAHSDIRFSLDEKKGKKNIKRFLRYLSHQNIDISNIADHIEKHDKIKSNDYNRLIEQLTFFGALCQTVIAQDETLSGQAVIKNALSLLKESDSDFTHIHRRCPQQKTFLERINQTLDNVSDTLDTFQIKSVEEHNRRLSCKKD